MPENTDPHLDEKMSEYSHKISGILKWADQQENFSTTFVEKISEVLENRGKLSVKQMNAIDNIIEKFDIDIDA